MTESETRIAEAMANTDSNDVSVIRDSTGFTPQMFNNCKKKMLGKGIISSKEHGCMEFSLPRFRE